MFYKCPDCSELFAADTAPLAQCANCRVLLRVLPPAALEQRVRPETVLAWEQPDGNVVGRFIATCRQILAGAPQFFHALSSAPGTRAEWFAYIAALVGLGGYFAGQLLLAGETQAELAQLIGHIAAEQNRVLRPDAFQRLYAWCLALTPLLALLPAHVAAGLYQMGIFLLGRRTTPGGYELTFRIAAYGLMPMVFLPIPELGMFIAPGWILALHWVGLTAAHRLPLGASFLCIALPWLTFLMLATRFVGQLLLLVLTTSA